MKSSTSFLQHIAEILEDRKDIEAFQDRRNEPLIPFDDVINDLKVRD
jgi:hypothetical protein